MAINKVFMLNCERFINMLFIINILIAIITNYHHVFIMMLFMMLLPAVGIMFNYARVREYPDFNKKKYIVSIMNNTIIWFIIWTIVLIIIYEIGIIK
jgi:hypothetical protein